MAGAGDELSPTRLTLPSHPHCGPVTSGSDVGTKERVRRTTCAAWAIDERTLGTPGPAGTPVVDRPRCGRSCRRPGTGSHHRVGCLVAPVSEDRGLLEGDGAGLEVDGRHGDGRCRHGLVRPGRIRAGRIDDRLRQRQGGDDHGRRHGDGAGPVREPDGGPAGRGQHVWSPRPPPPLAKYASLSAATAAGYVPATNPNGYLVHYANWQIVKSAGLDPDQARLLGLRQHGERPGADGRHVSRAGTVHPGARRRRPPHPVARARRPLPLGRAKVVGKDDDLRYVRHRRAQHQHVLHAARLGRPVPGLDPPIPARSDRGPSWRRSSGGQA